MTPCLSMYPMPESGMLRMVDVVHICVAMKPTEGNFAQNALKHGVAGLNVDGCRVATAPDDAKEMERCNTAGSARHKGGDPPIGTFKISPYGNLDTTKGRWPANVMFQHHPECVLKGVKKVDGNRADTRPNGDGGREDRTQWRFRPTEATKRGYSDEEGKEDVEDWECHEDCPVKKLDEQSGISESKRNLAEQNLSGSNTLRT